MKRFKNLNKTQLIFNIPHGRNRFLPIFTYNPCKIGQVLNFSRRLLCENRIRRQGGKITCKILKEISENNLINSKSNEYKRKYIFQPICNIVQICRFHFPTVPTLSYQSPRHSINLFSASIHSILMKLTSPQIRRGKLASCQSYSYHSQCYKII